MNLHAHMPGQVTVQVPNQGSSKLTQQKGNSLASQMQNIGGHAMDHELMMQRRKVQETIVQCLMKGRNKSSNPNAQWLQKIPELSRRLEERIFKDTSLKEDYMSLTMAKIEQQIQVIAQKTSSDEEMFQFRKLKTSKCLREEGSA